MKKRTAPLAIALLCCLQIFGQSLYFPNNAGSNWANIPPTELGFCQSRIDSLYHFLETNKTKSFMLLKDGKIVLEKYFGTYTQDSIFYWASAGKSLTAFLVGQAIDEGLIALDDKTSEHLGVGWTSAPADKEDLITVRNQLTMTTGLDDDVPNDNCNTPDCLLYKADAGTRWAYHNAPYRLLQDVLAEASGISHQQFTKTRLFDKVGMKGFWFNYIMYGRARDMARFGLLMLADGIWNGDTLLRDPNYLHDMVTPSQTYNKSYGYLWWLNGQPSLMLPTIQTVFPGPLCPNAPADMYAALGRDDQKIHVVPSKGWVVVRQGLSSNGGLVPIAFDNELWGYLNALDCGSSVQDAALASTSSLVAKPTVSGQGWTIVCDTPIQVAMLYNAAGRLLYTKEFSDGGTQFRLPGQRLPAGTYRVMTIGPKGERGVVTVVKN
jgi:CubicO group peptidase (beta-lactamase class C family)